MKLSPLVVTRFILIFWPKLSVTRHQPQLTFSPILSILNTKHFHSLRARSFISRYSHFQTVQTTPEGLSPNTDTKLTVKTFFEPNSLNPHHNLGRQNNLWHKRQPIKSNKPQNWFQSTTLFYVFFSCSNEKIYDWDFWLTLECWKITNYWKCSFWKVNNISIKPKVDCTALNIWSQLNCGKVCLGIKATSKQS